MIVLVVDGSIARGLGRRQKTYSAGLEIHWSARIWCVFVFFFVFFFFLFFSPSGIIGNNECIKLNCVEDWPQLCLSSSVFPVKWMDNTGQRDLTPHTTFLVIFFFALL